MDHRVINNFIPFCTDAVTKLRPGKMQTTIATNWWWIYFLRATVKLERFVKLKEKNIEGNDLGTNSKKFKGDSELE